MQRGRLALPASLPRFALARVLAGDAVEIWPTVALLGLYALIYVEFAVQLAAFPFDLDQGEGYDAWSAWLINLGQVPYSSNAEFPYYSSNYPPLWSYIVSIPMAWLGPSLASGRVVSAISAAGAAGVLGFAAARMSGRRLAGVLAAGFFLASPYVFHTTPLARVNSLALLAALVGISLFEQPTWRRVVLGSLFLLAALFTKPTAIDAAFAGVLSVGMRQPRLGLLATGLIGGLGLAGLAGLLVLTHGAFWLNVIAGNANPFDLAQLIFYLTNFVELHCVLLALAAAECVWLLKHGRQGFSPWALYGLAAGGAALGVAKWGAGESYFLGAIAAMCVLGAVWSVHLFDVVSSAGLRLALGSALLIQAVLLSHADISAAAAWLPDRGPQRALLGRAPTAEDEEAGQFIVSEIRRLRGATLSEDPSFAVVAGEPVIGNATHLRNLYLAGLWDPGPMVSDIQAHKYAVVILDAELYPEPVLTAIGQAYFLDRTVRVNGATYRLFLPGTTHGAAH